MWKSPPFELVWELLFRDFYRKHHPRFSANRSADHYAGDVTMRAPQPPIPAEALARQARLRAALQAMETVTPSLEPACLQELRAVIAGRTTVRIESSTAKLQQEDLVEEAVELLRASRREAGDPSLIEMMTSRWTPLAAKAQQRRSALWQLDTRRVSMRLGFAKEGDAVGFDDGDLHALFLQAFKQEGLRLALDLGKRPRPLLNMALPLPAGVAGRIEFVNVVLKHEPTEEPEKLMARLNHRLPEGLQIHQWLTLPGYASEVGDLAQRSHWRWDVPPEHQGAIRDKVTRFLGMSTWPWNRGPAKSDVPLDLRVLVADMGWDEGTLCLATRMGAFQAINPLKMLGAILELDPAAIQGLVRTHVDLKPDPRAGQAERFEPKLKNMYEDAVLLGGGSNIVLVDEDDDEPIHLGPPSESN